MASLRNIDMTDRELLFVIAEVSDHDGLALAQDVAEHLGINPNGKRSPAGTVSSRMAWMKRYGFVDRVDPKSLGLRASDPPRWIITDEGHALMGGRIAAAVARELDRGDPGTELLLMRELSRRAYVEAGFATAAAVRREWLHQSARRGR